MKIKKNASVTRAEKSPAKTAKDYARPTKTSEPIRLNKHIADCGAASRRGADEMIQQGQVMVNGKKVYELGMKIDPETDHVTVKGKPLRPVEEKVYLMFHKPKSIVTTMEDPEGRPTIGDYVKRMPFRVFPVGRLDWDTEGLILLTNDGDFSQKVTHPSFDVEKTYLVKVNGHPSEEQLQKLRTGVTIPGGKVSAVWVERLRKGADQYDWLKLVITEGKNRQIKYMMEKIGFDVMKLQRVAIGRLKIGSLRKGEFKVLTPTDLSRVFEKGAHADKPEYVHKPEFMSDEHSAKDRRGPTKSTKPNAKPSHKTDRPQRSDRPMGRANKPSRSFGPAREKPEKTFRESARANKSEKRARPDEGAEKENRPFRSAHPAAPHRRGPRPPSKPFNNTKGTRKTGSRG